MELLYRVVLLDVQRVHDREHAEELGCGGQVDGTSRNLNRALNLELTEGENLFSSNDTVLKRDTNLVQVPLVEVPVVGGVHQQTCRLQLVNVNLSHEVIEGVRGQVARKLVDLVSTRRDDVVSGVSSV